MWFTDRGLDYLRSAATKPWFLHLGYRRPHPPLTAPAPYHDMFDPAGASEMLSYAQRMLDWRLRHAERTLTGYAASPSGLISRP